MFNSEKQKIICNHYKIEIRSLCSAMVFSSSARICCCWPRNGMGFTSRFGWYSGWLIESRFSAHLCAMGIRVSPAVSAGRGASTVRTPSLLREERIDSGLTPLGSRNSRLYSLYTLFVSDFSSCLACTY